MTAELLITLLFLVIVLIAILYVISIWVYKRAPANMGFIRTGYLGTKVCLGRGAMVLPVFHEVTWVSLETLKLIVSRSRESGGAHVRQDPDRRGGRAVRTRRPQRGGSARRRPQPW